MYYIDTLSHSVQSFLFDNKTGQITKERDVLTFDGIFPDGMCIDENDNLWIAFYGSGMVRCYHPMTGKLLATIEVPALCTTSCAFGGADLDMLYITSAAKDGDTNGGALFSVKPGVKGRKVSLFKK